MLRQILFSAFFLTSPLTASIDSDSLLLIKPADRAQDIISAFNILAEEDNQNFIELTLVDGTVIKDIKAILIIGSGTLLEVEHSTEKGFRKCIIAVEAVMSIAHPE